MPVASPIVAPPTIVGKIQSGTRSNPAVAPTASSTTTTTKFIGTTVKERYPAGTANTAIIIQTAILMEFADRLDAATSCAGVTCAAYPSLLSPPHFVQADGVLKPLRHELAPVGEQKLLPREQPTH